jgi:hypothetical protein
MTRTKSTHDRSARVAPKNRRFSSRFSREGPPNGRLRSHSTREGLHAVVAQTFVFVRVLRACNSRTAALEDGRAIDAARVEGPLSVPMQLPMQRSRQGETAARVNVRTGSHQRPDLAPGLFLKPNRHILKFM